MRYLVMFIIMLTLVASEAFAQRRPYPPRPRPPQGPFPRPIPPPHRPMPTPVGYACHGADLFEGNWLIHRFRFMNDCHQGMQDLRYRGRFCDEGAMYNRRGHYLRHYGSQWDCRRSL